MRPLTGVLRLTAVVLPVCLAGAILGGTPARADEERKSQWYLKSLRISAAHRISEGAGVTVAVLDTGVRSDQPDLRGAVLSGFNALGSGDGRKDTRGHGTAMAAIIAARGRSGGRGLLGIAPGTKILPVGPATSPLAVTEAIKWSVDHGAKVINLSFGVLDDEAMQAAVKDAVQADVVLVAATGNDGEEGIAGGYPAAYPEVLAVGATDRNGKVAAFSNRGPQVDLVAPGVDIPVPSQDGDYQVAEGTSASTAIVSGAAALIRSRYPELTAADVVRVLESTAADRGPAGRDDTYGHGELDVLAALQAAGTVKASAPVVAAPPRTIPGSSDGGDSRLVIIGIGVLVVAGGAAGVLLARRRSRSP